MKRTLSFISMMIISVASAFAQDKEHSIEITTGYPSIMHFAEYPWAYRTVEMGWNGQTYKEHYQPGISFGLPIPIPYVAPIGIKFGKGKVYGIVEANISAATTFGMAGIGIKL